MQGVPSMSEPPFPGTQCKVANQNVDQTRNGGSCAIMDFDQDYTFVWWKVQLSRLFNVAYIKLYLRNEEGMLYRYSISLKKILLVQVM